MRWSPTRRSTFLVCILWTGLGLCGCPHPPPSPTPLPNDVAVAIRDAWDFDDPATSEATFRQLARESADPDRAQFETQIARALGLQRRFPEALAILDALEPRLDSFPEVVRIRSLLERGRCLRSNGSPTSARSPFLDAWDRSRDAGLDELAIDAAHMVALTMNGDEALAWNERALAVANDSTDPLARRWRTSLYNNIAWTHHESGDYARALDNFQKALTESRALDDAEVTHIAKWSVGRALRSLRRHAEALAIQRELASEATPADGYVFEEIAENLLALGRGTESTPYFAEAFALLSNDPELAASEPERIERLRALAGTSPEAPRE